MKEKQPPPKNETKKAEKPEPKDSYYWTIDACGRRKKVKVRKDSLK